MKPSSNCFSLRSATREEVDLFYSDGRTDRSLGIVDYVRIDFGPSDKGFYHTWKPHDGGQFNIPKFKETLQQFVDVVRKDEPLKGLSSMGKFRRQNGGAITEDGRSYGYPAEMGDYCFYLRCTPNPGEYQCCLYYYNLRQQTLDKPVGRVSFADDEHMEFTAPQDYLRTIQEGLLTKDGTGSLFETLTDALAVHKAVSDIIYDLYGEENPGLLEDYVSRQGPEMGGQQM